MSGSAAGFYGFSFGDTAAHRPGEVPAVSCGDLLVGDRVRRLSQNVNGKETQCRKCQKDRNESVHTHHALRGAERQSISYLTV